MTINDLGIGYRVALGSGDTGSGGDASIVPFEWIKLSSSNDFMLARGDLFMKFDTPEAFARSREHRACGSNYYPYSNVDQWLNSRAETDWFSPAHDADTDSGLKKSGFLSRFTDEEYGFLEPRTIVCKNPPGSIRRHGEFETIHRLVSLPSVSEILPATGAHGYDPAEGSTFEFFLSPQYMNTFTRSTSGPGSVISKSGYSTVCVVAPSRINNIRPIIRIKGDAAIEPWDDGDSAFRVVLKSDTIDLNEMEFLSLLNAR